MPQDCRIRILQQIGHRAWNRDIRALASDRTTACTVYVVTRLRQYTDVVMLCDCTGGVTTTVQTSSEVTSPPTRTNDCRRSSCSRRPKSDDENSRQRRSSSLPQCSTAPPEPMYDISQIIDMLWQSATRIRLNICIIRRLSRCCQFCESKNRKQDDSRQQYKMGLDALSRITIIS